VTLTLSTLENTTGARRPRKRVGRGEGSGSGKTCGRGQKGQMSRSGHKRKPGFEGGQMRLIRRIPKRGFTSFHKKTLIPVNISMLDRYEDGATVDLESLKGVGLVRAMSVGIKILGDGELKKKLTVKAMAFSASAKAKIEAAGGTCEVVQA